jgi:hypothetical protein
MNKEEAEEWAKDVCELGTYPYREAYKNKFEVGSIANYYWNEPLFTLGMEYGIKIAVAKIFGDLDE